MPSGLLLLQRETAKQVEQSQSEVENTLGELDSKLTHLKLLREGSDRSQSICITSDLNASFGSLGRGKRLPYLSSLFSSSESQEEEMSLEKTQSLRRKTAADFRAFGSTLQESSMEDSMDGDDAYEPIARDSRGASFKETVRGRKWVTSMGDAFDLDSCDEDGRNTPGDVFSEDVIDGTPLVVVSPPLTPLEVKSQLASSNGVSVSDREAEEEAGRGNVMHWVDKQEHTWC